MSKEIYTAECRFCNQVIQLSDPELTEEQAVEEAIMHCNCLDAVKYRKEKKTEGRKP